MSNVELPPQKSPTDTSNWDDRAFSAPKVTSVGKVKKSVARREMVLNAPERKRRKYPKNPDIVRPKKR